MKIEQEKEERERIRWNISNYDWKSVTRVRNTQRRKNCIGFSTDQHKAGETEQQQALKGEKKQKQVWQIKQLLKASIKQNKKIKIDGNKSKGRKLCNISMNQTPTKQLFAASNSTNKACFDQIQVWRNVWIGFWIKWFKLYMDCVVSLKFVERQLIVNWATNECPCETRREMVEKCQRKRTICMTIDCITLMLIIMMMIQITCMIERGELIQKQKW